MVKLPEDYALTSHGIEGLAHTGYKGSCHCLAQAQGRTLRGGYMPVGGDSLVVTTS